MGVRQSNIVDHHVGSRIRLRRMVVGLSQQKLAAELGLTFQQVQKYERGVNRVGAGRLYQIAVVLGVSVQFFYEGVPHPMEAESLLPTATENGDVGSFMYTSEGVAFNAAYVSIKEKQVRRQLLALMRALVKVQDPDKKHEGYDATDDLRSVETPAPAAQTSPPAQTAPVAQSDALSSDTALPSSESPQDETASATDVPSSDGESDEGKVS